MTYHKERYIATQAIVMASKASHNIQKSLAANHCLIKKDGSPVTIADYASQVIIACALFKAFPHIPILAEEDCEILQSNQIFRALVTREARKYIPSISESQVLKVIDQSSKLTPRKDIFWTLDPIDGTKGFIKNSHYAIALALIQDNSIILGLLGCPNLTSNLIPGDHGAIYIAEKGKGAKKRSIDNPTEIAIAVSKEKDPSKSTLCASPISSLSRSKELKSLRQSLKTTQTTLYVHGQCKYALVAEGTASLYYRLSKDLTYQEKIWDHAAGCIIVDEAGGVTTDFEGKKLDFSSGTTLKNNCGILSTTKNLQKFVLHNINSSKDINKWDKHKNKQYT